MHRSAGELTLNEIKVFFTCAQLYTVVGILNLPRKMYPNIVAKIFYVKNVVFNKVDTI